MSAGDISSLNVVIAGQPNTGKSTVFTALTGLYQDVGNWAGKTVEKRIGRAPEEQGGYTVIDLPGSYSLRPDASASEDERIAVNFLRDNAPDLTVVVASACSPERTLAYALDAMLLGNPLLIALNMADVAAGNGLSPDPLVLEKRLGVPVVLVSATQKSGREALRRAVSDAVGNTPAPRFPAREITDCLPERLRAEMSLAVSLLQQHSQNTRQSEATVWKAFEGDAPSREALRAACEAQGEPYPSFQAETPLLLQQAKFA